MKLFIANNNLAHSLKILLWNISSNYQHKRPIETIQFTVQPFGGKPSHNIKLNSQDISVHYRNVSLHFMKSFKWFCTHQHTASHSKITEPPNHNISGTSLSSSIERKGPSKIPSDEFINACFRSLSYEVFRKPGKQCRHQYQRWLVLVVTTINQ